jgi:hypothetical protein
MTEAEKPVRLYKIGNYRNENLLKKKHNRQDIEYPIDSELSDREDGSSYADFIRSRNPGNSGYFSNNSLKTINETRETFERDANKKMTPRNKDGSLFTIRGTTRKIIEVTTTEVDETDTLPITSTSRNSLSRLKDISQNDRKENTFIREFKQPVKSSDDLDDYKKRMLNDEQDKNKQKPLNDKSNKQNENKPDDENGNNKKKKTKPDDTTKNNQNDNKKKTNSNSKNEEDFNEKDYYPNRKMINRGTTTDDLKKFTEKAKREKEEDDLSNQLFNY